MSEYRIRSTGEVKTEAEVRKMHSNSSLPRVWGSNVYETLGIDPVSSSSQPEPSNNYKVVVRNGVEQDGDGNWVSTWTENDIFEEYTDDSGRTLTVQDQIDAAVAGEQRVKRNNKLMATDHYALADFTLTEEMRSYRQALRDVPQQSGFPHSIVWPQEP